MVSWADRVRQADLEDVEILDASERLAFEHRLQWLRLSFLATPVLVVLAFGAPAVPYAFSIVVAVSLSFAWIQLLLRSVPERVLRWQLWLRILDCALVYLLLVNYHGFLNNAYYDSVYLLFVVAAAATHGRRGAMLLSAVAGLAVLASRVQLILTEAMPFEPRHLTDAAFYTLFFAVTSSAVAFLMRKSGEVVRRREQAWRSRLADRNADLESTARELAEAIRLRDAMLTGVTHDLRTPLTVIKVQSQLARRRLAPLMAPDDLSAGLEQIDRAAARMANWIDQLLEISKEQAADETRLDLRPADLVKLARQAIAEHEQNTTKHVFQLESTEAAVGRWDSTGLERVLDNLIGNAIKYSPSGGLIGVRVDCTDGWATLAVSDEGVGIPAADLPRIFEPFRRGTNVEGRISGTGIGLTGVRTIVERHGGTLEVESHEGRGSRFTVRLPVDGPPDGATT
jgi:signal transduction histidine kinase